MTSCVTDLRLAVRALLKNPGFAAATVLTLAVGMTLSVTAVVVLKAYLLEQLPYPHADRLFTVRYGPPGQNPPREMERLDWSSLDDVIEHRIAWDLDVFYVLGAEHAEPVPGAWVTAGFLQGLGIRPAIGPGLDERAFFDGGENAVLISHTLWQGRFGGDPAIVGRTFGAYVSDRPQETEQFVIAGVLPAGFWHINAYTDIIAPLRAPTFPYMVRLREGVSAADAQARIGALVRAGARDVPQNWGAELVASHAGYVQQVRPMLRVATAASTLVLLVACANVAGLLLIRGMHRQKEIAVRASLGATHGAIGRMLVAEGTVIGFAAMGIAIALVTFVLRTLGPSLQRQLGRVAPGGAAALALDSEALLFAAAVSLATALLCTAAPFLASLRSLQPSLQSGSRTATEGRRSLWMRTTLIGFEVAVSLALVAGAALMLRSVVGMLQTDLGFNADRVINASITLRQSRYPEPSARRAVFDRMVTHLSTLPGAESVALTTAWPVQQPRETTVEPDNGGIVTRAAVHGVTSRYFSTLNIPLQGGSAFRDGQSNEATSVIVSESLARRLWPDGQALGKRLIVREDGGESVPTSRTVVGVAGDVRQGPADSDLADLYVPFLEAPGRSAFVLLRTGESNTASAIARFRAAFREIDPQIAVHRPTPFKARVDDLTAGSRLMASLLTGFATVAALLALVGVYGVIAYAVRQRQREIAVRMALGANPARVTWLFLRQGGSILSAGLALGLVIAVGSGRLIESQLFGITPRDPAALAAAAALFGAAGLFAIWWPSRRAAAIDPAIALRNE